jgi:hypothetical protein
MELDPSQYSEADRREVDPPIQVDAAIWSPGGQRWVKAVDLRPKEGG